MEKESEDFKQLVYELMNGYYDLGKRPIEESRYVENEFEEGKFCAKTYEEIYHANERLCERLGVPNEDEDVETIISGFFDIMEHLCMKMYDYGRLFSKNEPQACELEPDGEKNK